MEARKRKGGRELRVGEKGRKKQMDRHTTHASSHMFAHVSTRDLQTSKELKMGSDPLSPQRLSPGRGGEPTLSLCPWEDIVENC